MRKTSHTHFKASVETTWGQKAVKTKLSYLPYSPHFTLPTKKQMKTPWSRKIKCFQKSYMTQKRVNEFCIWFYLYFKTKTIRLSQRELFLPTFVAKLVCVSAHTPGVSVGCSHLTLPLFQAGKKYANYERFRSETASNNFFFIKRVALRFCML